METGKFPVAGLLLLISLIYATNAGQLFDYSGTAERCLKPKTQSNYTPRGSEYDIGNLTVYESDNRSSQRLLIAVYDIIGFHVSNMREFVDTIAERYDFRVVLPDFFRGFPWDENDIPPSNPDEFDRWLNNNASWDIAKYDIINVMNTFATRDNITEVAIFGMCWGGKITALASIDLDGIKAGGQVHPGLVNISDAHAIKNPMYLMPASDDPDMLPYYDILRQKFGNSSGHRRFDDMLHGFTSAGGNLSDPLTRMRFDEAIDILGTFFNRIL